jgi:hypothetical protein
MRSLTRKIQKLALTIVPAGLISYGVVQACCSVQGQAPCPQTYGACTLVDDTDSRGILTNPAESGYQACPIVNTGVCTYQCGSEAEGEYYNYSESGACP